MKEILDAIQSPDTHRRRLRRPAAPRVVPRDHRAQGRGGDVRGARPPATRTPASRSTWTRSRCPNSARARPWSPSWPARSTTTPCGPRSSSRCRPSASWSATASSASSPSATTCRTTSSAPTWRASSCAPAPASTPGSPGDEVVAHCLSVELESSDGHNDTMLDPEQRIWGFETNFGGLAEIALVKSNQLMPKPEHLSWEEAAAPGPGQLHRLPPARLPQRRRHEAGRQRADLGRQRRTRLLRHPVRAGRRRQPDLCRLQRRRRRRSAGRWAPRRSSTATPRATSSGRTSTPRTRRSGSASASASAS